MKCLICKEKITPDPDGWEGGHNAEPILNGRCCNTCNEYVLVLRLKQMTMRDELDIVSKFDTRVTIESLAKYIVQDRRNQIQESK